MRGEEIYGLDAMGRYGRGNSVHLALRLVIGEQKFRVLRAGALVNLGLREWLKELRYHFRGRFS